MYLIQPNKSFEILLTIYENGKIRIHKFVLFLQKSYLHGFQQQYISFFKDRAEYKKPISKYFRFKIMNLKRNFSNPLTRYLYQGIKVSVEQTRRDTVVQYFTFTLQIVVQSEKTQTFSAAFLSVFLSIQYLFSK